MPCNVLHPAALSSVRYAAPSMKQFLLRSIGLRQASVHDAGPYGREPEDKGLSHTTQIATRPRPCKRSGWGFRRCLLGKTSCTTPDVLQPSLTPLHDELDKFCRPAKNASQTASPWQHGHRNAAWHAYQPKHLTAAPRGLPRQIGSPVSLLAAQPHNQKRCQAQIRVTRQAICRISCPCHLMLRMQRYPSKTCMLRPSPAYETGRRKKALETY